MSWGECCTANDCKNSAVKTRQPGDGLYNIPLLENRFGLESDYFKVYPKNGLDFSGYNNLEFYLQLNEDISPSSKIYLEIYNQRNQFLRGNIFDYVINGVNFQAGKTMHIKMPVADWGNINKILFVSKPSNIEDKFQILHMQLTKDDPSANRVCSGKSSTFKSSWLENLDYWDEDISGKEACNNLSMKWLGDNADAERRCCGNSEGEYYANPNLEFACWNSQPLVENQTIADVQLQLSYGEGKWKNEYLPVTVSGSYSIYNTPSDSPQRNPVHTINPITLSYSDSPKVIAYFPVNSYDIENITLNVNGAEAYFFNPLEPDCSYCGEQSIRKDELEKGNNLIYIMAEVNGVKRSYEYKTKTEILNYTCAQAKCYFPLKGNSPYTIKNLNQNNYDLYYNYKVGTETKKVLIDKEMTFYGSNGWLEAVNIPQQIIFANGTFFSCGNWSSLAEASSFCSIKGGSFCSPLSSWDNKNIPRLTYDDKNVLNPDNINPEILPTERNHFSSIVFGRNLLLDSWFTMAK